MIYFFFSGVNSLTAALRLELLLAKPTQRPFPVLYIRNAYTKRCYLISALRTFRSLHPDMGRAKVLQHLCSDNSWAFSEKRLKTCMDSHNLNTVERETRRAKEKAEERTVSQQQSDTTALPKLPPNPRQAQLKYLKGSNRFFILYGR
jgi:hypothetical protein